MTTKHTRYIFAVLLITAMTAAAELLGEQEVIFPEIAALAAGMWVVDKHVWHVSRRQVVGLMTLGAAAGICIVRFSPLPLSGNVAMAFLFAAGCLTLTGSTLVPLISACMLPVLLGADSLVYPSAVLIMTLLLTRGQAAMERRGMRRPILLPLRKREIGREIVKWLQLLAVLLVIAAVPIRTGYSYVILPPLVVTFVEFSRPEAGLRRAAVQIFGLIAAAALLGAGGQYLFHVWLGLPSTVAALVICCCLFTLFEAVGRIFAPAGAIALIPLIIPAEDLAWYPLQATLGAGIFIVTATNLFRRPAHGYRKKPAVPTGTEP